MHCVSISTAATPKSSKSPKTPKSQPNERKPPVATVRHVAANAGRSAYSVFIAASTCGLQSIEPKADDTTRGYRNVLIVQQEEDYQESSDMARKVTCEYTHKSHKPLQSAPVMVDGLHVEEIAFPGEVVDVWMEITRGDTPFAPTVAGVVPIGERLTIAIYIRDSNAAFDVHAKDCVAYDSPDYHNENTRSLRLTDDKGCGVRSKLLKGFSKTRDTRNSGATVITYAPINAFKFPVIAIRNFLILATFFADYCSLSLYLSLSLRRKRWISTLRVTWKFARAAATISVSCPR